MRNRKTLDPALVESMSENILNLLPFTHNRLLCAPIIHREYGLSPTQVRILSMLNDDSAIPIMTIADRMRIAKPNIIPLVDRLVKERLVDRVRGSEDRRIVNIVILGAGRDKLHAIHATINEQCQVWVQNISSSDISELKESLESLARILSPDQMN